MKINQLGTLAILGVVVSFTAACGGSPTKPTSATPAVGNGALAESVNLSTVRSVDAVDQICTGQMQTFDETDQGAGVPNEGVPNADAPPVTCTSPAAADQSHEDVVLRDAPTMDSARFVHRLSR